MTLNDHLLYHLNTSLQLLTMTLSDFSNTDLLTRPTPTANHPNWQIGHLIASEHRMLSALGAAMPPLPAGFDVQYNRDAAAFDEASAFLTKDQLLALFQSVRNASIAWTRAATPEQFASSTPEQMRSYAPTAADAIAILPIHVGMHLGQIQVLRRKLDKPVLF